MISRYKTTMRIQLASDLHLELLARQFPCETLIRPADGADVLVLAGDVGNDLLGLKLFAQWPAPVVYVLGKCRVVANPRSYARSRSSVENVRQLQFEKPHFQSTGLIDVWAVRARIAL